MAKRESFTEHVVGFFYLLLVFVTIMVLLAAPAFAGLFLYFVLKLPPIALWIGGAVLAVYGILLLMHLSWVSTFWPKPIKAAFDKVMQGLSNFTWP